MMTAQIRFDHMHPLVEAKQKEVEGAGEWALSRAREKLLSEKEKLLNEKWEKWVPKSHSWGDKLVSHVKDALGIWKELSEDMLVHFSDNSDIPKVSATHDAGVDANIAGGVDEDIASLSYPAWWLRAVGFANALPLPPVESQCPPVCPGSTQLLVEDGTGRGFMLAVAFVGVSSASILLVFGFVKRRLSSNEAKESVPYSQL